MGVVLYSIGFRSQNLLTLNTPRLDCTNDFIYWLSNQAHLYEGSCRRGTNTTTESIGKQSANISWVSYCTVLASKLKSIDAK